MFLIENPSQPSGPPGRRGAAVVEKIVIATLIVGVLGPIAWVVGTNELEHLSGFSSSLEHHLTQGHNRPATDQAALRSPLSDGSNTQGSRFVSTKIGAGEDASDLAETTGTRSRVLWISLLSATVVTLGLFWVGLFQHRKDKGPSNQSAAELQQSLRSLKTQLEKEMRPGCVFTKRQQTMKTLLNQFDKVNCQGLQIRQLLTRKVKTILPTTSADELRDLFTKNHYRHILVCDSKQQLLGIITARDLQRKSGKNAADFMTTELVTVSPDHSVCPVISTMMDKRVSCLPVVENSRLIGIVTTTDLLIALQCTLQILGAIGDPSGGTKENQTCSIVDIA